MSNKSSYESLLNAAAKLSQQAATDKTIAERLLNDPGKAISEAAGQPLPKGVKITVEYGADGKSFRLKPEMEPGYSGELDDKVLDQVAGGKGQWWNVVGDGTKPRGNSGGMKF